MNDPMKRSLAFSFYWDHRATTINILPKCYRWSFYRYPFISFRFLCFWIIHDWNPFGPNKD